MKISYRGAVAILNMMLLPCGMRKSLFKEWRKEVGKFADKSRRLTPVQRRHLKAMLAEIDRRQKMSKNTIIYAAGMYTSNGVPASRGRRVKMMPFGTWYYKPLIKK
jgi:hypothetical protein